MHLRDYEQQLTDYIRGKSENAPFESAYIYKDLFLNNMINFVRENKPELIDVLGDDLDEFVLEFYRDWKCKTPFFYEILDELNNYCLSLQEN